MNVLRRMYRLFQSEGERAVLRATRRKVLGYFDPIYQVIKPRYKTYSVGSASAVFDMKNRQLNTYDFVDDLNSEREIIKRILSTVTEDDVFYDIGANYGVYSCLVGDMTRSGQVVAFEPIPEAFETLQRNIKRNNIEADLFNVALSNKEGTVQMSIRGQTGHQFAEDDEGKFEAKTRRADELVTENDVSPPDICKIDIEGAEYLALDGFRKTLAESECRHVFCEIHTEKIQDIGGSAERVEDILTELGFKLEYLGDRRDNYFVEATRSV